MDFPWVIVSIIASALSVGGVVVGVNRQTRKRTQELRSRFSGPDEDLVLGPESCAFRGTMPEHKDVKGNGVACLTNRRLVFVSISGTQLEFPVEQISGARIKGNALFGTGGYYLRVSLGDDCEVDFLLLKKPKRWIEKLQELCEFSMPIGPD
jgi:hypothetical protein